MANDTFDDFLDDLERRLFGGLGRQVGEAGVGITGDVIDNILGIFGLDPIGIGDAPEGEGPGTAEARRLLETIENIPLQSIPAERITPALAAIERLGDPALAQESDQRAALLNTMAQLQDVADTGITDEDRAMLNLLQSEQARRGALSDEAILEDLANRGQLGSLDEILTRQLGRQGGAREANLAGLEIAQQAAARRDQALRDLAGLQDVTRGRDIALSQQQAETQNLFDRLNQAAANRAAEFNAQQRNLIERSNRDALLRAIGAENEQELQRMRNEMQASQNLSTQLNAEEAARARQEFARQLAAAGMLGGITAPVTTIPGGTGGTMTPPPPPPTGGDGIFGGEDIIGDIIPGTNPFAGFDITDLFSPGFEFGGDLGNIFDTAPPGTNVNVPGGQITLGDFVPMPGTGGGLTIPGFGGGNIDLGFGGGLDDLFAPIDDTGFGGGFNLDELFAPLDPVGDFDFTSPGFTGDFIGPPMDPSMDDMGFFDEFTSDLGDFGGALWDFGGDIFEGIGDFGSSIFGGIFG